MKFFLKRVLTTPASAFVVLSCSNNQTTGFGRDMGGALG